VLRCKIIILFALLSLTTAAFISACSSNTEVRLTERDDGRTVTLRKNQLLTITLMNPVLPWRWELAQSQEGVVARALSEEQRRASPLPQVPVKGRRTDTIFAFKAIAPGQVMLTFVISRPDRQDGDPRGTFEVRVNVQ
jgi:predicted secreted protein